MSEIDPMYTGEEKTKREIFQELCDTDRTYPCKNCTDARTPAECAKMACPQWKQWVRFKWEEFQKMFDNTDNKRSEQKEANMDKWTLQEEAYKRGLEDGMNARQSKKKGIWLRPWNSTKKSYIWQCSECGKKVYSIGGIDYKFCPYCQAEMEVAIRDSHNDGD